MVHPAQAYYTCQAGKITIIPYVRVGWEHEGLYSDLPITVSAPALGEATATFNGPAIGHDSLIINANVGVQWTPRISTTIGYDGQLARDRYSSHAVTARLTIRSKAKR